MFLAPGRVDVGDIQYFDINERGHFQYSEALVRAIGVAAAGLVTVKADRIDSCGASAFLGASAEECTPCRGRNPPELHVENGVVGSLWLRSPQECRTFLRANSPTRGRICPVRLGVHK